MFPTFYVLGAQKAGTSWLHHVMKPHPEICTGVNKEVHYFDTQRNFVKGPDWYSQQFIATEHTRAVGDFTPNYLRLVLDPSSVKHPWFPTNAVAEMAKLTPDAKFIVSLRDPVARAVSAYFHNINQGRISARTPMIEAMQERDLIEPGLYWEQLTRWFEVFPRERFLIFIYEADLTSPAAREQSARAAFRHIRVADDFGPLDVDARVNRRASSLDLRAKSWPRLAKGAVRRLPAALKPEFAWKIRIAESDRRFLQAVYRNSNVKLQHELGRTLPWDL